jgi:hypothetical protein
MPTGTQIITRAVTALNIIDDGGGISPSELAGLLVELNAMVDAWATEETLIPSVATAQYALTANQNPYPIGPAAVAPFNVARPVRIDRASMVSTVGTKTTRNDLKIVDSRQYFGHGDLTAAASTADELYPDYSDSATGAMNLYLFPVPSCPTVTFLEMQTWNPIAAFALGANQNLPPGYEDAIVYGLAYRCLPRYGAVVNQATAEIVAGIGKQAKDRVKTLNVQNRLMDPSLLPQQAAPPAGR